MYSADYTNKSRARHAPFCDQGYIGKKRSGIFSFFSRLYTELENNENVLLYSSKPPQNLLSPQSNSQLKSAKTEHEGKLKEQQAHDA